MIEITRLRSRDATVTRSWFTFMCIIEISLEEQDDLTPMVEISSYELDDSDTNGIMIYS